MVFQNAKSDLNGKIFENVIEAASNTPLIEIKHFPEKYGKVEPHIFVKLEFLNLGGSTHDKTANAAFKKCERELAEKKKAVVVAGGSMAISFGVVAVVKGVELTVVAPKSELDPVSTVFETLGVKTDSTSSSWQHNGYDEYRKHAASLASSQNMVDLTPVLEEAAIIGHRATGTEINLALKERQLDNKLKAIFVPSNTGRTAVGISKCHEHEKVYAVTSSGKEDIIPELGNDLLPSLKGQNVDVYSVDSIEAVELTKYLISHTGMLIGSSTGAAVLAAIRESKHFTKDDVVVVIAVDGTRNHMHGFLDDEWLNKTGAGCLRPHHNTVKPKEDYDPAVLKYDPTSLSSEWLPDNNGSYANTCPFTLNEYRPARPLIVDDMLEAIGNTPLIKLQRIPKKYGVDANIFVKCEFVNSGGSIKDRIAKRMIQLAEQENFPVKLGAHPTFIEPTSGNTGIGLALACAVKGYGCVIAMPEKMSKEKAVTLDVLGAAIVRTPTEAAFSAAESHIGVSLRLKHEIPDAVVLDQYRNPGNVLAHYEQTAEEIIHDMGSIDLDAVVIGAGTGGTVTGTGRKLREKYDKIRVVGVDPEGSILADPTKTETESYEVEGIGYDFVPGTLDRSAVDEWRKSNDKDSFQFAKDLIHLEGILAGGSSGSALHAAIDVAKTYPDAKNIVVILPDGIRNYLSKFLDKNWLASRHLSE